MSDRSAVTWKHASDDVLIVALRRPPANALGVPVIEGLNAALDAAGSAKVVVVTSEVDGFFAAGADIKHMATVDAESFAGYGDALRGVLERLAAADRISIAAVDGVALGGGMELAMACALRVAGAEARFGLPEVKLGLIPGAGGTQRLPRLVGRGRALDLMLTGRQIGADEAYAAGLVDRLVDAGKAEATALELAAELCRASLPAQLAVVRAVDTAYDLPLADGLRHEADSIQQLFQIGEAAEGIAAFLDKRPPSFR